MPVIVARARYHDHRAEPPLPLPFPRGRTLTHLVVGTAGHVDHGKTRLVQALTGIDCDRLAEEKARGITIDLGFAHLAHDDVVLGFVDVPGHQRFVHNALAGLGGIRLLLLVVAADAGIEPQTREHLAICRLLGIPRAVVALTKCDLVEPELVELARLEIAELLAASPWPDAPTFPVSSVTGEGIDALRAALLAAARELPPPAARNLPARLPVDRAFHLRGLGVVATGTLAAGAVAVGDTLEALPAPAEPPRVRLRSLQVHGQGRERADCGERVAVQLAGADLDQLTRGRELVAPGAYRASRLLAVELTLLPEARPLAGFVAVRVHLFAAEALGRMRALDPPRLEPGGTGLVEIRLAQPLVATRGDRCIVRRPSPAATLAGGVVADPFWPRRRGKTLAALVEPLRRGGSDLVRAWVTDTGTSGLAEDDLLPRFGAPASELTSAIETLLAGGSLLAAGQRPHRRLVTPGAYRLIRDRARELLRGFFTANRLAPGMPRAELLARLLPARPGRAQGGGSHPLADTYLGWLAAERLVVLGEDLVNLPGHTAALSGEESRLERDLVARYEAAGLEAPSPAQVALELGAKPQIVEGVLRYLVDRRRLVRLPSGLFTSVKAIEALREALLASGWERFSVPQFKERFGLSRKWAIPLLEHLDGVGATRRVGDERLVVRRRPATPP